MSKTDLGVGGAVRERESGSGVALTFKASTLLQMRTDN